MERTLEEAYAAYEAEIGVKLTPGQKELIKEDMIYEEQVDLNEESIRANAELFRKNVACFASFSSPTKRKSETLMG